MNLENLQKNVPLAPFTTYKIGGPADLYFPAKSPEAITAALLYARDHQLPVFILGTGANILVGDRGFRGLIIHNQAQAVALNGHQLTADSGAVIGDLIELTASQGLSGLEHFAGIPSSVGGALWQNLHFLAPNRQETVFIGDLVESAVILDEELTTHTVDRAFFRFGYDYSLLHDRPLTVLQATFNLIPADSTLIRRQIEANLDWRRRKHPPLETEPSAGSVFKKIAGVGAGRLIDQAGLRGRRLGGAKVSEKHTNFIVNASHATAADVRGLIDLVQTEVEAKTGYRLEPEIQFIGEF
jgi:UDP-N-acetylmuramate dehydrogenase